MRWIRQSPDVTRCQYRSPVHFVAVIATLGVTACAGAAPTSPSGGAGTGGSDVLAIEVSCPTALLIGQKGPCIAVARLRSGQSPLVSFDATWSSTNPEVVAVDTLGVVNGRSAGHAIVSASYRGRQGSATLFVTAEDAFRIDTGQAQQGDFRPGSTVTMWLQGYYSVASAESGRLSLRISDQTGTIHEAGIRAWRTSVDQPGSRGSFGVQSTVCSGPDQPTQWYTCRCQSQRVMRCC